MIKKTLKFALACIMALGSMHADAKDVYGFMTGNGSDGEIPIGMYKFDTSTMTNELLTSATYQFWGGAYAGDKYLLILSDDAQGYLTEGLCRYDIDTKELSFRYAQQPYQCSDLTYDYSTATLYGVMTHSTGESVKPRLISINAADGSYTKVAELKKNVTALACTYFGDLYAMGGDGCLYTMDKTNGDLTLVGNTGITASTKEAQSMEFDRATGELYWTGLDQNDFTFFCQLNPLTGEVIERKSPADNALIVGLHIPFTVAESGAPAKPQNLKAARGAGGKVTLSWTNPGTTYGGATLSGALTKVEVWRGATLAGTITDAQAGQEQEFTDAEAATAEGRTRYVVYAYNSVGRGEGASAVVIAGDDTPTAVTGLTATPEGNGARLAWTAPTTGKNGGTITPENLTYTITRQHDGKVLGEVKTTSFTDNTISAAGYYSWSVTCKNATGESDAAQSALTEAGPAVRLPYTADFGTAAGRAQWLVQDNNADGNTWTAGLDGFTYNTSYTNSGDDDLLSVTMHLKKGVTYKTVYDILAPNIYSHEHFKLSLQGNGATKVIEDLDNFTTEGFSDPETRTAKFTVDEDGDYKFRLSALSESGMFMIKISAFSVAPEGTGLLQIQSIKTNCDDNIMKAGKSAEITVKAKNTGDKAVANYTVTLADKAGNTVASRTVESAVEPGAECSQSLSFTPQHKGDTTLVVTVAAADGEKGASDSKEVTFRVAGANETLTTMGGKDFNTDFPFWFGGYAYSYAQAIYKSEETGGKAGDITDIEYDYSNDGDALADKHIKVFLCNTANQSVEDGWIAETDMTLAADTTVTFENGDHTLLLHLKAPFGYTGGNLCIMTQNIESGKSDKISFYATGSDGIRTAIYNGETPDVDLSKVQGSTYLNYVRLTMVPGTASAIGGTHAGSGLGIALSGAIVTASKAADITVSNIAGSTVACKHGAKTVNLSGMPSGIYIVKAEAGNEKVVKKVVVK